MYFVIVVDECTLASPSTFCWLASQTKRDPFLPPFFALHKRQDDITKKSGVCETKTSGNTNGHVHWARFYTYVCRSVSGYVRTLYCHAKVHTLQAVSDIRDRHEE